MMKSVLLPLLPFVCACDHGARQRAIDSDVYAIYAAALDSIPTAAKTPLQLSSRTWQYSLSRALGDTSALYRGVRDDSAVGASLLEAFDAANARETRICDCFAASRQVQLVDAQLRADEAGAVFLSAVGFDRGRDRALVAAGQVCGQQCSWSMLYALVRTRVGWTIVHRVLTGTS